MRRLLTTIPILLLVTFGVYGLITLVPGDPAVALAGGETRRPSGLWRCATSSTWTIRSSCSTAGGCPMRFAWTSVGHSWTVGVWEEISNRFPMTLSIALMAMALGLLIGVPAGRLPARGRDR